MNPIFKHNCNAIYSTKDLKGGYTADNFLVLNEYPNEKGPPVKIQLLSIFKDHYNVEKSGPAAIGYDEWQISSALWMKCYSGHGKYESE